MSKSSKRIGNELKALQTTPVVGCTIILPDPNNLYKWIIEIPGPKGSPYEEGIFKLSFAFPDNYPFKHPEVKFLTPMYHPNIKKETGEICMDVFASSWSPTQKVSDILEKLSSLLVSPSTDSPLEPQICEEYLKNHDNFVKNVRNFVSKNKGK